MTWVSGNRTLSRTTTITAMPMMIPKHMKTWISSTNSWCSFFFFSSSSSLFLFSSSVSSSSSSKPFSISFVDKLSCLEVILVKLKLRNFALIQNKWNLRYPVMLGTIFVQTKTECNVNEWFYNYKLWTFVITNNIFFNLLYKKKMSFIYISKHLQIFFRH